MQAGERTSGDDGAAAIHQSEISTPAEPPTADFYDLDQVLEYARSYRTRAIEVGTKSSGWFLAISVALNAGACLALFGAIDRLGFEPADYILFLAGICAVMISSATTGTLAYRTADRAADLENAVFSVQNSASQDHSEVSTAHGRLEQHRLVRNVPMLLRFAAIALFFGGVAHLSRELPARLKPQAQRCLALQNDMLSAHPRRTDDTTLFQALRCQPQGRGGVHAIPRGDS